ncbi:serine/threonine protein phosphatase 2C [Chloropicon primus]|uniref:protein-serine/threonine phosphatase n=1 Tax=Chloropicon primus TaxID=1764295 RepID=A0A5B8MPZ9_9CHLO|nr:serine/threonine protein phosphatase 2C [Chloropicon primus]UPR01811.1 serine/threonine protein phosphatase 2C [Chloropicon primus]|eukprot:QDZ22589.1 serine/threonine protein phosphatase 2C [Chloropicon primus]
MAEEYYPTIEYGLGRTVTKGEDFHVEEVGLTTAEEVGYATAAKNCQAVAKYGYFGVFDGHGGKGSAKFCSESLLGIVLKEHAEREEGCGQSDDSTAQRDELLSEEEASCLRSQEAFVSNLPGCLDSAFKQADLEWKERDLPSGTTATVAFVSAWELVCASVGDSCAYFHTGKQLLQVSGNHRIEEDKETGKVVVTDEIKRVRGCGGSVARAEIEGKAVGPLRIWPGGLAMTRTLGDKAASEVSSSTPEVRHLSLPQTGGRLIMASDGLWDAVTPKQAFSLVKSTQASKAATKLCKASVKALGKRDDITVIVVDVCPPESTLKRDEGVCGPAPKQHFVRTVSPDQNQKPYDKWKAWNTFAFKEACRCVRDYERMKAEQAAAAAEAEAARALAELEMEKARGIDPLGSDGDDGGWELPKGRNSSHSNKDSPSRPVVDEEREKRKKEALERKKLKRKLKKLEKMQMQQKEAGNGVEAADGATPGEDNRQDAKQMPPAGKSTQKQPKAKPQHSDRKEHQRHPSPGKKWNKSGKRQPASRRGDRNRQNGFDGSDDQATAAGGNVSAEEGGVGGRTITFTKPSKFGAKGAAGTGGQPRSPSPRKVGRGGQGGRGGSRGGRGGSRGGRSEGQGREARHQGGGFKGDPAPGAETPGKGGQKSFNNRRAPGNRGGRGGGRGARRGAKGPQSPDQRRARAEQWGAKEELAGKLLLDMIKGRANVGAPVA